MNRADLESLDKPSLVDLALRLAEQLTRQAERIAQLEARLAEMEQRFAELERRAVRGAAPFARAESKRSLSPKFPAPRLRRAAGMTHNSKVAPPEPVV